MALATDIERRRTKCRTEGQTIYEHMFIDSPQRTDMTFWVTREGDPPKTGVPEESKGIRVNSPCAFFRYEVNHFRCHAMQNFVYWMRKDESLKLAPGLVPRQKDTYSSELRQCNQCSGKKYPQPELKKM
ncbi:hypothetical protein ACOMHN_044309 [Nucella lapillus]